MSTHKPTLVSPLAITIALGENVTDETNIVLKINTEAVILQKLGLFTLPEIIYN